MSIYSIYPFNSSLEERDGKIIVKKYRGPSLLVSQFNRMISIEFGQESGEKLDDGVSYLCDQNRLRRLRNYILKLPNCIDKYGTHWRNVFLDKNFDISVECDSGSTHLYLLERGSEFHCKNDAYRILNNFISSFNRLIPQSMKDRPIKFVGNIQKSRVIILFAFQISNIHVVLDYVKKLDFYEPGMLIGVRTKLYNLKFSESPKPYIDSDKFSRYYWFEIWSKNKYAFPRIYHL